MRDRRGAKRTRLRPLLAPSGLFKFLVVGYRFFRGFQRHRRFVSRRLERTLIEDFLLEFDEGSACVAASISSSEGGNASSVSSMVSSSVNSPAGSADKPDSSDGRPAAPCSLRPRARVAGAMPRERFSGQKAAAIPCEGRFNQRGRLECRRRAGWSGLLRRGLLGLRGGRAAILRKRFAGKHKGLRSLMLARRRLGHGNVGSLNLRSEFGFYELVPRQFRQPRLDSVEASTGAPGPRPPRRRRRPRQRRPPPLRVPAVPRLVREIWERSWLRPLARLLLPGGVRHLAFGRASCLGSALWS